MLLSIALLLLAALAGARAAGDSDDLSLLQTFARTRQSADRSARAAGWQARTNAEVSHSSSVAPVGNGSRSGDPRAPLSTKIQHAIRLSALHGSGVVMGARSPEDRSRSLEAERGRGQGGQGRPRPDVANPLLARATAVAAHDQTRAGALQWASAGLLLFLGISLLWQFGVAGRWLMEMHEQNAIRHYSVLAMEAVPKLNLAASVSLYGFMYIACSSAFITYNNYLVSDGRFPFAANLAFGHQVCGSFFLLVLYKLCPFLYPSLVEPEKRANCFTLRFLIKGGLPIASCFSMQLVLSNFAYLYASVAFLQMMKEGNMVLVYLLSLLAGLEGFSGIQVAVLFCLLCSTLLTIEGELQISCRALLVQGSSQLLEATKIVAQSSLLSAAGSAKLDALSYNLLIQPLSAIGLLIFVISCMAFVPGVATASWADYVAWWPHLVGNACTALALNVVVALFISKTSAIGYIVVGILKDIVLVVSDVVLSGTRVSQLQIAAFSLQILFVAHYSFFKSFSKQWESLHRWSKAKTPSITAGRAWC